MSDLMMIQFTLWQVWPNEPNREWTYLGMIFSQSMESAVQEFKEEGRMTAGWEYIITIA